MSRFLVLTLVAIPACPPALTTAADPKHPILDPPPRRTACGFRLAEADLTELETFLVEQARLMRMEQERRVGSEIGRAIHDPTDEGQLEALRYLVSRRHLLKTDPRRDVAHAMSELARSADANVRAEVWRLMAGCTEPSLQTPLIEAATYDPEADVRGRAIAALAYHLPAPEVVRCLEELGSSPLDEDIRQAALIALYGGEPWCESR